MKWGINIFLILISPLIVFGGDTIVIADDFLIKPIGRSILFTSTEVDSFDYSKQHSWIQPDYNNFRVETNRYNWLKINLKNQSIYDRTLQLFLHNVQIEKAKLFVVTDGQVSYTSKITGCLLPVSQRPTNHRTISLPLMIPGQSISQVYVMVYRKGFGLTISPTLVQPELGIDFYWTDYCFFCVIATSIFLILVSVLFNFFEITHRFRFKEIFWLQVYLFISTCYIVSASGLGSMYIWGSLPWFEMNASIFFGALSSGTFILFCNRALGLSQEFRYLSLALDIVAVAYILTAIPGFFLFGDLINPLFFGSSITISYLLMLVCLLVVMGFGGHRAFVLKDKVFYWFLGIFGFLVVYTVITFCLELGIIRYDFKVHALHIMFVFYPQMLVTLTFFVFRFLEKLRMQHIHLVEYRREISHDIHDEIGSSMTKINLSAHLLSTQYPTLFTTLNVIKNEATDANMKLRDIIFAINPTLDKFNDLLSHCKENVSRLQNPKCTFTLKTHDDLLKLEIEPILKMQMIIYFDEILKIIKHVECNVIIEFDFRVVNNSFVISYDFKNQDYSFFNPAIEKIRQVVKKYDFHYGDTRVLSDNDSYTLVIELIHNK